MTEKQTVQLSIRLPDEIYQMVSEEAQRQRRSINAQIMTYLETVLPHDVTNTQVSMPKTSQERAAALERIR